MNLKDVEEYLKENKKRVDESNAKYDPVTGEGSFTCVRKEFHMLDKYGKPIYIPADCFKNKLICDLHKCGSIKAFLEKIGLPKTKRNKQLVYQEYFKARIEYDFEFWTAKTYYIKKKDSPEDILFILNQGQRLLLKEIYDDDKAGKPVRIIMPKSRQFGGSTLIQAYIIWKMIVVLGGTNSVIVAHVENTARVIRSMYSKMLKRYPKWLLTPEGYDEDDVKKKKLHLKLTPFEGSVKTLTLKEVGCRTTIGSAENPDSIVGDDNSMAHFSEVGLYKSTPGKTPEQLVQSIAGGITYTPNTLIVYESTARGVGNFFYREYMRAAKGESAFKTVFIPWMLSDFNSLEIDNYEEFVKSMTTEEKFLFKEGATLEGLNWRRFKMREMSDEWRFKSEYPATALEAFQSTGHRFYPIQDVERLRKACRKPTFIGEIYGKENYGTEAMKDIVFKEEAGGRFKVWYKPDDEIYSDRYIVVMDIGGTSARADNSVIYVLDRKDMALGGVPITAAEWCGHIDHDLLAWKAVQIATVYQNAQLIIESNTFEKNRTKGNHFEFILDEIAYYYTNLFCRTPPDKVREGLPAKWGFHTNSSSKPMICDHNKKVLRDNLYIELSSECCDEYDQFEEKEDGSFGAVEGARDDRNITRCIALWAAYSYYSPPRKYVKVDKKKKKHIVNESSI